MPEVPDYFAAFCQAGAKAVVLKADWWFFAAYVQQVGCDGKAADVLLPPCFLHYRFLSLSLYFLSLIPLFQHQTAVNPSA